MKTRSNSRITSIDLHIDVDRSQSTQKICGPLYIGLVNFINEQKQLAIEKGIRTNLTIKLFSERVKNLSGFYNNDITKVPEFTPNLFKPRGGTRLIDTAVESLQEQTKRVDNRKEEKVLKIYALITDGLDNSSTRYKKENIVQLLNNYQKEGHFAYFLGANQDAIKQGKSYGFDKSHCMTFKTDEKSVYSAMKSISAQVSCASVKKNSNLF